MTPEWPLERAGRLELELFSMLCSREIFTDQSYHACIRSEKNPSIRSDACMTEDYARGQPASAWPLAGQPCNFDCNLHTIARAHNRTFFVRLVRALCPHVPVVECSIMCTPIMHSAQYTIKTYAKMTLFPLLLTGPLSVSGMRCVS